MATSSDMAVRPYLSEVTALLKAHHRFAGDIVERSATAFGPAWASRFQEALGTMFPEPEAVAAAVRGYAAFAMTSLRLQAQFERTGQYAAKTYEEAAAQVYHNDHYMQSEYLPGLFLSHYLWPHHYRQVRFFETAFLEPLAVARAAGFAEIGVGTGLYSRIALQALPEARGLGLDISPSSQRFSERQMAAFGLSDRYDVLLQDVVRDTPEGSADNLICVEVLEHLEDPIEFLVALRRTLKPGGLAFITAAINAAHTDHIYLYRHPGEVEAHLIAAGFTPEQYFAGQAYKPSRPGVPVPVAVAFVAR